MKKETFLLLTSEEGMKHRSQRQMKEDMHYKRFRHFGKDTFAQFCYR